jgi:type 1 fimbria pilin
MKKIILAITLFVFLFSGISSAFYDGHVYINGKVNSISSDSITISGSHYKIDKNCKVVIQYKEHNSFHEKPASLWDVSSGDTVTAKKIGSIIYEIMLERWRR